MTVKPDKLQAVIMSCDKKENKYDSKYVKIVWQTLITFYCKTLIDSLTKLLKLYHMWFVVNVSYTPYNFQKALKIRKKNGNSSKINKLINWFTYSNNKVTRLKP